MRFLFLITHYDPVIYGAELFAKNLAEYLVSKGHTVDLVTGQWEDGWKKFETIKGVNVHRVPVLKIRFIQTIFFIFPQWIKARSLLDKHEYDFIHAHIFPSLVTGALLSRSTKKIVTIQGGDLADYPEVYGPTTPVIKPLIAWSLKQFDRLHAVSSDLKKQIKAISGKKSLVVPNGVDQSLLTLTVDKNKIRKKFGLKPESFLIISPSRLTDKNNLEETIKAIQQLRQKDLDVQLAIAGTGHLESKLLDQINQLDLKNSVKLLGHVPHQKVLDLIKTSDCLVRVSTKEGFGIALLEGLALGVPVVSSQNGGLADFITNKSAFVSESTKARDIAIQIEKVISSKDQVGKRVRTARKIVKDNFTWGIVLENFLKKIYKII